MNTLIVAAHPDHDSLTVGIARLLEEALPPGSVEVAELAAEGFDPRFGTADREAYRGHGDAPADVVREHGIVDYVGARRGTTVVLHESERDDAAARDALVLGTVDRVARAVLEDAPRASSAS